MHHQAKYVDPEALGAAGPRKVDIRLPGKGNSNSHGARPVHSIITMIKWTRTSRLSIKNSLSAGGGCAAVREVVPPPDMLSARKVISLITRVIRSKLVWLITDLLITQP